MKLTPAERRKFKLAWATLSETVIDVRQREHGPGPWNASALKDADLCALHDAVHGIITVLDRAEAPSEAAAA